MDTVDDDVIIPLCRYPHSVSGLHRERLSRCTAGAQSSLQRAIVSYIQPALRGFDGVSVCTERLSHSTASSALSGVWFDPTASGSFTESSS